MDTQHSGYGEVDVEVGVVVEVRHGEQLALTALLIGQTVLPVQYAETEILLQCKGYETDVSRRLHHVCSVFGDGGHLIEGGTVVVDTQIGVPSDKLPSSLNSNSAVSPMNAFASFKSVTLGISINNLFSPTC